MSTQLSNTSSAPAAAQSATGSLPISMAQSDKGTTLQYLAVIRPQWPSNAVRAVNQLGLKGDDIGTYDASPIENRRRSSDTCFESCSMPTTADIFPYKKGSVVDPANPLVGIISEGTPTAVRLNLDPTSAIPFSDHHDGSTQNPNHAVRIVMKDYKKDLDFAGWNHITAQHSTGDSHSERWPTIDEPLMYICERSSGTSQSDTGSSARPLNTSQPDVDILVTGPLIVDDKSKTTFNCPIRLTNGTATIPGRALDQADAIRNAKSDQ